jgi:hypothetical protein
VLRIFRPKNKEMEENWRRRNNEELRNPYTARNTVRVIISRSMTWAGYAVYTGQMTDEYKILVGETEGKRPFRRPRRRWENNIKIRILGK